MSDAINALLDELKRRSTRDDLIYPEVVMIEDVIAAFERIRTKGAKDLETGLLGTRVLPSTCHDAVRRWKSS